MILVLICVLVGGGVCLRACLRFRVCVRVLSFALLFLLLVLSSFWLWLSMFLVAVSHVVVAIVSVLEFDHVSAEF